MSPATTYAVYGLAVHSDRTWPGLDPAARPVSGAPPVRVLAAPEPQVRAGFSGAREPGRDRDTGDGPIVTLRGHDDDMLLDGGEVGVFHLTADGGQVLYGADPRAPRSARMLLDTVLGTAALRRGLEGLHAAGVIVGGQLVAITAGEGAGKTSLAIALMHSGGTLFSDDLLFLSLGEDGVLAHPGPALVNVPHRAGTAVPGEVLATIGDERWTALPHQAPGPQALALVVVLDRQSGAGAPRLRRESSPAALIAHALDSGPRPERLGRRLELLGLLADAAPTVRLTAGSQVGPQALAQVVGDLVASLPRVPVGSGGDV